MENKHTMSDLYQMQSLPLSAKVKMTERRIDDWVNRFGEDGVYVSFSGGKDSTVLLDLVRRVYPDVKGAFSDTGLEYPEIREFVKSFDNIDWLKPKKNLVQIITEYGYPIISKEVSENIYYAQHGSDWAIKRMEGLNSDGSESTFKQRYKKYNYLVDSNIPVSHKCCSIMKKQPAKQYEKETGLKPIIGTMTHESHLRKEQWLKYGCNAFNSKRPKSAPLSFWNEQDILEYIDKYKLPVASVYGDLVRQEDGTLKFTGCQRTGCVFCGYGCHLDDTPNRFQRLAITHPQLYDYCMRGGKFDDRGLWVPDKGLGMSKVLDYIGVDYKAEDSQEDG